MAVLGVGNCVAREVRASSAVREVEYWRAVIQVKDLAGMRKAMRLY